MRAVFAALLLLSLPAAADKNFAPIPSEQTGGKSTGLEMRVVDYRGSTNGSIEVEVRNPTNHPIEFSAKGIYFVPDGDPDHAPQRVGAVGPFQVKQGNEWQHEDKLTLAAGTSALLKLEVYCIDSHRGSPSSSTAFHVGKSRVPKKMVDEIDHDAQQAAAPMGGIAAPSAKSAVQSQVWKNRDKKWVPLDGEGKQEATK
jgi:hypothetical protein